MPISRKFFATLCLVVFSTRLPAEELPEMGFQDFLLVPLRIHLLSSVDAPELHTTLTAPDIARILRKANGVWAPAGIQFFMESLVCEAALPGPRSGSEAEAAVPAKKALPDLRTMLPHLPPTTRGKEVFNVYFIRSFGVNGVYFQAPETIMVKDTASLRPVEGGIDEPIPRVTSHELGHAFSLPHRQDNFNLMASGTTGTALNGTEIRQARESAAQRPWILSAKSWQEKAAALARDGKSAEAEAIYGKLAVLPLDQAPEVREARKLASPSAAPDGPP